MDLSFSAGELQQSQASHGVEVRVVDWALDPALASWDAVWDYGALALLTDCLYASMPHSDYTYIGKHHCPQPIL